MDVDLTSWVLNNFISIFTDDIDININMWI